MANIEEKKVMDVLKFDEFSQTETKSEGYTFEGYDGLNGHLYKQFFRYDAKLFKSLFKDIRENNSSYISYLNDLLAEDSEIEPQMVSCLVKELHYEKISAISEVIGSKLMNYFSAPTVYNVCCSENHSKDGRSKIMSADICKEGDTFYTLGDYMYATNNHIAISDLNEMVNDFRKTKFPYDVFGKQRKKIINDFIMSSLLRMYVIGDIDFTDSNCGIILNKKSQKCQLVNFDYEMGMWGKNSYADIKNLEFVKNKFPEIYKEFIRKLKNLSQVKKTSMISSNSSYHYRRAMTQMLNNVENALSIDALLQNKKELKFNKIKEFFSWERTL